MTGQPLTPEREQEIREWATMPYAPTEHWAAPLRDALAALDAARAERDEALDLAHRLAVASEDQKREVEALREERDEYRESWKQRVATCQFQVTKIDQLEREVAALRAVGNLLMVTAKAYRAAIRGGAGSRLVTGRKLADAIDDWAALAAGQDEK